MAEESLVLQLENGETFVVATDHASCEKLNDWGTDQTQLLISTRISMEDEFQKPALKWKLWTKVANILKENGYKVEASECDRKWRNLLKTYRANVARAKKLGEATIKWVYFNPIHQLLGCNEDIDILDTNNDSTCDAQPSTSNGAPLPERCQPTPSPESGFSILDESCGDVAPSDECSSVDLNPPTFNLKRKRAGPNPYLWLEEERNRRAQEAKRRAKEEARRWARFEQLEERKIAALEALVTLLRKRKKN